jgi:hypothetical protein
MLDMGEDEARLGVAGDPGHLARMQLGVDRHCDHARADRPQQQHGVLDAVAEEQQHPVARLASP